ncbi:MAG: UDP-N-acetylglucosamine 2-epimerase (hydrolyzing) [Bacteroidetes bacterium]|nr:UDP-N-acetylglucosamine 2-epimerase (hydrolyzing) [Bacteroidota bacterium]
MLRKICIVTGSRSEYGLLRILMSKVKQSRNLQLQVIVTGMHLSPEFGLTYREIEKDGFTIDARVEMQLSSDTASGITKSTGLGMIGFADALERLSPDILVVLGDRYESFAAAISALFFKIPVAHLHGGETTEGAFDEAIRHSISKISMLHFTATEAYRKRVIQMGEDPKRVFNVGAIGIEAINSQKLLTRSELEKNIGYVFRSRNLLVTYHPETLSKISPAIQFGEMLAALSKFPEIGIIFTYPNSDVAGRVIIDMINEFCTTRPNAVAFKSLGSVRYLSCLKYVDGLLGNSSSAIIELPSFKRGAINIGGRQKGRLAAANIINCAAKRKSIISAIDQLYSSSFRRTLKSVVNPYYRKNTSSTIVKVLSSYPLDKSISKPFHDIDG